MIDTDARIQINRDSLKKIVKLTAESKIDKKLITDMMEWMEVSESSLLVSSDDRRFDLIQRAKDIQDR